ncbi:MAG: methyltransferase domain-containing protein [Bacteroidota bacterium]
MNWRAYWDHQAASSNAQAQVARTLHAQPLSEDILDQIVTYIAGLLDLQPSDRLLDICCGNGLLTERLATKCAETIGVDLSAGQIARAQELFPDTKVQYRTGDAAALPVDLQGPFDKINLYFSFQYLDRPGQGAAALAGMAARLKPGGSILLGDVPDLALLDQFYPQLLDRWRYRLKVRLGRSLMGKFWAAKEIARMAHANGLELEVLDQPSHLPYAHYRRDFLLKKLR